MVMKFNILVRSQSNMNWIYDEDMGADRLAEFKSTLVARVRIERIMKDNPIGTEYFIVEVIEHLKCEEEILRNLVTA